MTNVKYGALKEKLKDGDAIKSDSFSLLQDIAKMINTPATHSEGRDLIIRALEKFDSFPEEDKPIFSSLLRAVGLFPYMKDLSEVMDVKEKLVYEFHRPKNMGAEIVFHSLQANIYNQLLIGNNVIVSANTSVGKSLVIDAYLAVKNFKKIVIVLPTLALIDETRRRLTKRFQATHTIITHPSQEASEEKSNIYILTQERVLQREDLKDIDFFVVDEFYKVNLDKSQDDTDRAVDLNLAFHRLASTYAQFYLLGPNIQAIRGLSRYNFHFIQEKFSTVAVDVTNYDLATHSGEREKKLIHLCNSVQGGTIIYCQAPPTVNKIAQLLLDEAILPDTSVQVQSALDWIAENYHSEWIVFNALKRGIAIHHGGIPRALQQYFLRLFNEGVLKFLICTSTIIEGVNTSAKNVIVYDRRRNQSVFDYFTYKNIEGRAGRMTRHYIGNVYVLEGLPEEQNYVVEFPIENQSDETPLSLILDLDAASLSPLSEKRLQNTFENSTLSADTLRKNRFLDIPTQEGIADTIRGNLGRYSGLLNWSGQPDSSQLEIICDLIYEFIEKKTLNGYGVHSGKALARQLWMMQYAENITAYFHECINTRNEGMPISDAIEQALKFLRNSMAYRLPRDIMAIENIQRDVLRKAGHASFGDYGWYATRVENLFLPSALAALDEKGIPLQVAYKIKPLLDDENISLNDALRFVKGMSLNKMNLSVFEQDLITEAREYL